MEICESKIKLITKPWMRIFIRGPKVVSFEIKELAQFEVDGFIIHWKTISGETGSFKYSTKPEMVHKIQLYLQKKIEKHHKNSLPEIREAVQFA